DGASARDRLSSSWALKSLAQPPGEGECGRVADGRGLLVEAARDLQGVPLAACARAYPTLGQGLTLLKQSFATSLPAVDTNRSVARACPAAEVSTRPSIRTLGPFRIPPRTARAWPACGRGKGYSPRSSLPPAR